MRDSPFCRPLDGHALGLVQEERLGASSLSVVVKAFVDGVVEDRAVGDDVLVLG